MWLDFWRKDYDELLRQFGHQENIKTFYRGLKPHVLVDHYQHELKIAKKLSVEYMVFHVGHVRLKDAYSWNFSYDDREVLSAAVDLINQSFPKKDLGITLLFENLWWPGLTLLDRELTQDFLKSIHYPNKGLLLDLSHLMITEPELKHEHEAKDYIIDKINGLGTLKKEIRGVHINKSLPGEYLKRDHSDQLERINLNNNFWKQVFKVKDHIDQIDRHLPFKDPCLQEIIALINPLYSVFELVPDNLAEFTEQIRAQNMALGR